ncbi:MAG TPA: hypothetical protein VG963_31810, partial [Polyangiaceae bacterium]|nr:hypothetical protein [Polyangiaceae bacterium]
MIPTHLTDWASRHTPLRTRDVGTHALGGLIGGLVGGAFVVAVTLLLKQMMDFFALQTDWMLIVVPLMGLVLTALVLHGLGRRTDSRTAERWRSF